jgi:hypothetical protein
MVLTVASFRAERWAQEFPGEDADAASLRPELMKGGRLSRAVPDVTEPSFRVTRCS